MQPRFNTPIYRHVDAESSNMFDKLYKEGAQVSKVTVVVSSVGERNIVIWSTELVNWPIYVISSVVDEQTW